MSAVRVLTIADFRSRRGSTFELKGPNTVVGLVLDQVQELPPSGREGGSFRLEFHGPMQPLLNQGTYPVRVGGNWVNIFIVPLGFLPQAMRYEAVFY